MSLRRKAVYYVILWLPSMTAGLIVAAVGMALTIWIPGFFASGGFAVVFAVGILLGMMFMEDGAARARKYWIRNSGGSG